MCTPLASCMPTVCQNNDNLWIHPAFGILFLAVPALHFSPMSGTGCLRKPDCALLRSPAPPRGMILYVGPRNTEICAAGSPLIFNSVPFQNNIVLSSVPLPTWYLFQPVLLLLPLLVCSPTLLLPSFLCISVSGWYPLFIHPSMYYKMTRALPKVTVRSRQWWKVMKCMYFTWVFPFCIFHLSESFSYYSSLSDSNLSPPSCPVKSMYLYIQYADEYLKDEVFLCVLRKFSSFLS